MRSFESCAALTSSKAFKEMLAVCGIGCARGRLVVAQFEFATFRRRHPEAPRLYQRSEESRVQRLHPARDPSLRLKGGRAQDDADWNKTIFKPCHHRPRRRHSIFPSDILDGFRGILASTVTVSAGASLGNTTVRNTGLQACRCEGRFGSIFQEPSAACFRTNA
jgi:hypothetical protein